jgi:hypothetical protein
MKMRYVMPMVPMRLLPLLSIALAVTGCAGAPLIVASPSACSALLPSEWREPVEGAPLPADQSVGEWIIFGDRQTGQLDKANDRTVTGIGIIERCEARDRVAMERARRPWWRFW